MLNKKDLEKIRENMNLFDKQRELVIIKSRPILKISKLIIHSVHRGDIEEAKKHRALIDEKMQELNLLVKDHRRLIYSGSFKVAVQEYVEAICFLEYVVNKRIPSHKELNVGGEYYLLGLCDLSGELARKAVNAAIKSDVDSVIEINELISEIYGEMLKFDMNNLGDLRKKFDSIKYELKKVENLVFDLKLKKR